MKKYEVTISVRLHGTVTVEAESEQEAEDIVGTKFNQDEINAAIDFIKKKGTGIPRATGKNYIKRKIPLSFQRDFLTQF